jgi:hypothetical protein
MVEDMIGISTYGPQNGNAPIYQQRGGNDWICDLSGQKMVIATSGIVTFRLDCAAGEPQPNVIMRRHADL